MKAGVSQPPAAADLGVLLYVDVGDDAVIIPKPVVYSEAEGAV